MSGEGGVETALSARARSAQLLPLKPLLRRRLVLRIDNYAELQAAYSPQAAFCVADWIRRRLLDDSIQAEDVYIIDDSHIGLVDVVERKAQSLAQADLAAAREFEALIFRLVSHPLIYEGDILHAALSGRYAVEIADGKVRDTEDFTDLLVDLPYRFSTCSDLPPSAWRKLYRADMALAAEVFAAVDRGELTLAWQPISHADGEDRLLYTECLVRIFNDSLTERSPAHFIPALERLGLIRVFDRLVMHQALDCVEDYEGSIGVNVSALSATCDLWWTEFFHRLQCNRWLATRLVVELTETAQFPSMGDAVAFADRLRGLGVRVAVDDFGVGYSSLRSIAALSPDIIKLDAFFIRETGRNPKAAPGLSHLIGYLNGVAPWVVLEGIATPAQAEMAKACGAIWLQGFFLGKPRIRCGARYAKSDCLTAPARTQVRRSRGIPTLSPEQSGRLPGPG